MILTGGSMYFRSPPQGYSTEESLRPMGLGGGEGEKCGIFGVLMMVIIIVGTSW